jgi:DNA-binding CsgD family transcriptional regulator
VTRFDSDEIHDLVGSIYDVALHADGWEPLLERMTALFEGTAAVFFVRDRLAVETVIARFWGLSDALLAESVELFSSIDVGLDSLLALPPASVMTDEIPAVQPHRSNEVLRDFLRRWDVERYVGGDVFRDARRFGVVTVLGSRNRAPFGEPEIELLRMLISHLRRAVELRSRFDEKDANRFVAQDVIEHMLTGVVLLDDRGHVLIANATARRIAHARDGLQLSGERLRAASPSDDDVLKKAIADAIAISQRRDSPGGAAITVRRPSGARPYAVLVSPGAAAASQPALRIASAVVLIGDPDSALAAAEELAMQLYGLTPSEARLACAVASGESLESYASARGINVSTARWTIKQALAKTGARRQADLVRILLTGPAAIAKRSGEET